jgi:hypothetical protein
MMRTSSVIDKLWDFGITLEDAFSIRRIAMTLTAWAEAECGNSNDYCSWAIERDPDTDKPYRICHYSDGRVRKALIPDRENGAIKRMNKLMKAYPELGWYHQTDPRGHSVYVYRLADLGNSQIDAVYSMIGKGIYK